MEQKLPTDRPQRCWAATVLQRVCGRGARAGPINAVEIRSTARNAASSGALWPTGPRRHCRAPDSSPVRRRRGPPSTCRSTAPADCALPVPRHPRIFHTYPLFRAVLQRRTATQHTRAQLGAARAGLARATNHGLPNQRAQRLFTTGGHEHVWGTRVRCQDTPVSAELRARAGR
jgi:hypothetical protein